MAFLDQLAHQFKTNNVLPPFFMNRNETALVLSLLIPGGGMFYKGHRLPGWGFYLSEMFLAGFCVYTKDDKEKGDVWRDNPWRSETYRAGCRHFSARPHTIFINLEQEGRISVSASLIDVSISDNGDPD